MNQSIQLIVGLANPGTQYANTRHNAGAWFIDLLLNLSKTSLKLSSKFHAQYAQVTLNNHACHLLIPTTYMNRSGLAVRAVSDYFKITPSEILIAHDDIDLSIGTVRLKFGGGDGGHNGIKDIHQHLHTPNFHRLRIGVGRPTHTGSDYVLSAPSKSERMEIDHALDRAMDNLDLILLGDMQKAMQNLHGK